MTNKIRKNITLLIVLAEVVRAACILDYIVLVCLSFNFNTKFGEVWNIIVFILILCTCFWSWFISAKIELIIKYYDDVLSKICFGDNSFDLRELFIKAVIKKVSERKIKEVFYEMFTNTYLAIYLVYCIIAIGILIYIKS